MVHTFGTSELIHLCIKCHQWFSFPLSFDDERNYQNEIRNLPMLWKSIISGNRKL